LLEKNFGKKIWEKSLVTLELTNELVSTLKEISLFVLPEYSITTKPNGNES